MLLVMSQATTIPRATATRPMMKSIVLVEL
ncbi:MAG: hypothetical protein A4E61_01825 [Syntrophorhabdus sp. PtaB.Bin184]|nr:MAG: hypothetical protein A4E61_01825 [Syntrophorhabdus sp. PtaB.Bin184]